MLEASGRLRLAYAALATAIALAAAGLVGLIERQRAIAFDAQYHTLQRTSEALASYLEATLERAIAELPPSRLEAALQALVDDYKPLDDVFNIRISRHDRVVLAALRRGNLGKPEALPLMLAALAGERGRSVEVVEGIRNYCVAVPLVVDGERWGAVILYRNLEPMYAAVAAAASALRWATLGVFALLLAASGGLVVLAGRELRRHRDAAARLALMGTMAASVAHEVRNPLNALGLSLDWLRRRLQREAPPSPHELAEELGTMQHQIGRLEHVVRDFTALARPPAIAPARVPLDDAFAHVVALFAPLAGERGIRLEAPPCGLTLEADPQRLEQVLINLVKNALEATPAGGAVRLAARPAGARVAIEVADSGAGIAPAQRAALFEPFRSGRANGLGLGLYLSKRLIEAHGGSLSAHSRPGEGTTFRIELPLAASAR
jgi:signal transduction histidine kinase